MIVTQGTVKVYSFINNTGHTSFAVMSKGDDDMVEIEGINDDVDLRKAIETMVAHYEEGEEGG